MVSLCHMGPRDIRILKWSQSDKISLHYGSYIIYIHGVQKGSSSKKNGPLTVRLTVWFDAPLPLLWSDFCGVSLILYYDYKCSETELHKKGVISIQLLLSPIPIYLLFYANKITRTTKRILLILHAELSRQRFI